MQNKMDLALEENIVNHTHMSESQNNFTGTQTRLIIKLLWFTTSFLAAFIFSLPSEAAIV
jgi:uncharacterized membrane protein (Fun14 family)